VAFRDGYIEINIGAHLEKEVKFLVLSPTGAVDAAVTARVWIADNLEAVVHLLWQPVEGDNLGGKIAVEFFHDRIVREAEAEVALLTGELTRRIRANIPEGGRVHLDIRPGKLAVFAGSRPGGMASPVPHRRQFLCREIDRCGAPVLRVLGVDGPVELRKGETKEVRVRLDGDGKFHWVCGDTAEKTRPDRSETTLVVVCRAPAGREIQWWCYKEIIPGARDFLCREIDRCGAPVLRVLGVDGPVEVRKGETKEVRVRLDGDGFFYWYCGDEKDPDRTRPVNRATTLVVVKRASAGREIQWWCYRE
jgi:hypothetical protein